MSSKVPATKTKAHAKVQRRTSHAVTTGHPHKKVVRHVQKLHESRRRGFTIIEVVAVIVILGILAAITAIGLNRFQADSRDSIRGSSTNVIVEALEKYYEENGEYPGCDILTGPREEVAGLIGVDPEVLTAPGAEEGSNSLRCAEDGTDHENAYVLSGDGSATCSQGSACLFWTIRYTKEADNGEVALDSRHRVQVSTAGTPILNGEVASSTSADMSWTTIPNTLNYNLQWSRSSSFTSPSDLQTQSTEATATGLQQGARHYFRVNSVTATGTSPWSNTHTLVTTVSAPAAPTTTASFASNAITVTSSQVTCASGTTAQYQFRSSRTPTATAGSYGSWSSWGTSRTFTISDPADGNRYTAQAQARCVGVDDESNGTAGSTADVVVPIAALGSAAMSASISGDTATGTMTAVSCPADTTAQYQIRYRTSVDSAAIGAWSSYDTWNGTRTRSQVVAIGSRTDFQGQARCITVHTDGPATGSSEVSTVRPFNAPSGPGVSVGISGSTATGTASVVSCANGSSPQYQLRARHSTDSANYGSWSSWSSWSTSRTRSDTVNEGARRGYQAQARCVGDFGTSSEAAGGEGAAVRGISTPGAPGYAADTTWEAGYRYRMTWNYGCPSGTWITGETVQVYSTGFTGGSRYPSSGYKATPMDDLWYLGWNAGQVYEDVYYYARVRCQTDFTYSNYSGESAVRIEVSCPSHRRSFSASPRCDNHGQNWTTMPYGP